MSEKFVTVATSAAKHAGDYLLEKRNEHFALQRVTIEGLETFKTEADIGSEKIIVTTLQAAFPDHNVFSEEAGMLHTSAASDYTWIVDPLHGTLAYVRGNQSEFMITLALLKGDEVICSVLYQPVLHAMYAAVKGSGSFLNDKRIVVNDSVVMDSAILGMQQNGFKYGPSDILVNLIKGSRRAYMLESAPFHLLSEGKLDLVLSFNQASYDFAANVLLVKEAGGVITDLSGAEPSIVFDMTRHTTLVAGTPSLQPELLALLSNSE